MGVQADAVRLWRDRRPRAANPPWRGVRALGGAGEMVADPARMGLVLDRAFVNGVPYMVNVVRDVETMYPRLTFGV